VRTRTSPVRPPPDPRPPGREGCAEVDPLSSERRGPEEAARRPRGWPGIAGAAGRMGRWSFHHPSVRHLVLRSAPVGG
jgi:hypothetical protein